MNKMTQQDLKNELRQLLANSDPCTFVCSEESKSRYIHIYWSDMCNRRLNVLLFDDPVTTTNSVISFFYPKSQGFPCVFPVYFVSNTSLYRFISMPEELLTQPIEDTSKVVEIIKTIITESENWIIAAPELNLSDIRTALNL